MAFGLAVLGVVVWFVSGPLFHFSNTWLLFISTATDVVIFVMVFSIQNTQNRESKAMQLKLNELINVDQRARATFIGLEALTDDELAELDDEFRKIADSLPVAPAVHKLHSKIKEAKARRK